MKKIKYILYFLTVIVLSCGGFENSSVGEACKTDFFCKKGLTCIDGICSAGDTGQACKYHFQCSESLYCDAGRCTTPKTIGMPCEGNVSCADSLVCRTGSCTMPGAVGDSCENDQECEGDMVCGNDTCSDGSVGSSCSYVSDCQRGSDLASDLICLNNICSAKRATGESCRHDTDCEANLFCGLNDICNNGSSGSECTSDQNCTGARSCINDVCTSKAANGAFCDSNNDCSSTNSYCNANTSRCVSKLNNGTPCELHQHCRSEVCRSSTTPNMCGPKAADGEDCEEDCECQSDICGNKKCSNGEEFSSCSFNDHCRTKSPGLGVATEMCVNDSDCSNLNARCVIPPMATQGTCEIQLVCFSAAAGSLLDRANERSMQDLSLAGANPCFGNDMPCCAEPRTAPHGICEFSYQCIFFINDLGRKQRGGCHQEFCSTGNRDHSCTNDDSCRGDLICDPMSKECEPPF